MTVAVLVLGTAAAIQLKLSAQKQGDIDNKLYLLTMKLGVLTEMQRGLAQLLAQGERHYSQLDSIAKQTDALAEGAKCKGANLQSMDNTLNRLLKFEALACMNHGILDEQMNDEEAAKVLEMYTRTESTRQLLLEEKLRELREIAEQQEAADAEMDAEPDPLDPDPTAEGHEAAAEAGQKKGRAWTIREKYEAMKADKEAGMSNKELAKKYGYKDSNSVYRFLKKGASKYEK